MLCSFCRWQSSKEGNLGFYPAKLGGNILPPFQCARPFAGAVEGDGDIFCKRESADLPQHRPLPAMQFPTYQLEAKLLLGSRWEGKGAQACPPRLSLAS